MPDGNCLFRALARQLLGDAGLHADVRQQVCDDVLANPALLLALEPPGIGVSAYVSAMRADRHFGTVVEVVYAQRHYRRPIVLYDIDATFGTGSLTPSAFLGAPRLAPNVAAAEWARLVPVNDEIIHLAFSWTEQRYYSVLADSGEVAAAPPDGIPALLPSGGPRPAITSPASRDDASTTSMKGLSRPSAAATPAFTGNAPPSTVQPLPVAPVSFCIYCS